MSRLYFLVTLILITSQLFCQEIYSWEDSVRQQSEIFFGDDVLTSRSITFDKMTPLLKKALDQDGSFELAFDSARISILYPPDSSFRIMTGQALLHGDDIRYYGLLQFRNDERNPILLTYNSYDEADIEGEVLTPETWNGAVYYNLRPYQYKGETHYLLFGFWAKSLFEHVKIAESLFFKDGQVFFGSPVFYNNENVKHRLSVRYSADVGIRLNYDEDLGMIVYDHLIPMKSPYPEVETILVPDGSYCGYTWVENVGWNYVEKLPTLELLEAPRNQPVLHRDSERNIFGMKKN